MVGLIGWGVLADEQGWRKGPWTPEEDKLLSEYVSLHGEGRWSYVARSAGLNRSGKSCRLRWVNYLRPGLKKGQLTPQEEGIIIELHALWGNKWSTIAKYLPGRTDNEIKNYWRTHFKKKKALKPGTQRQEKRRTQLLHEQRQLQKQEGNGENNKLPINAEVSNQITNGTQGKQDMAFMDPPVEDQYLPVMNQDCAPWSITTIEDGLWGALWNLDDEPHSGVDQASGCNHPAIQNQATANYSPCGGNYTLNWFDGGYIF